MSLLRNHYWYAVLIMPLLVSSVLTSCTPKDSLDSRNPPKNSIDQLQAIAVDPQKHVAGQTVYVPIYSHIYHYDRKDDVMNLSATLSIRNTDMANSIIITSVRYYDTKGEFIKQFVQQPVELKALASTDIFIQTNDVRGGLGANFIVEWVANQTVYAPVIEAIMISTASGQGISFVSPGRVLKDYKPTN